jgi:hypothetical protein
MPTLTKAGRTIMGVAIVAVLAVGVTSWHYRHAHQSLEDCVISRLVPKANLVLTAMHQVYESVLLATAPNQGPCVLDGPLTIRIGDPISASVETQSMTLTEYLGREVPLRLDQGHWAEVDLNLPNSVDVDGNPEPPCSRTVTATHLTISAPAMSQATPLVVPYSTRDAPNRMCAALGSLGTTRITAARGRENIATTPDH